jgi:diaminopimelate epimerase
MTLATSAGELAARVEGERVRLALPPPRDDGELSLEVGPEKIRGRRIHTGTPHFVTLVEDPAAAPLERWGPDVRHHPQFAPQGVNLDVVRIDGSHVQLRTWEKGVERETLACGSGAVAAALVARALGAGERVIVVPASGVALEVEFGEADGVALVGDARLVYEGRLDPGALSYAGAFDDR